MYHLALAAGLILTDPYVIDADTIRGGEWDYRVAGVDAPEINRNARCKLEDVLGEAAKARVTGLIDGATIVRVSPADRKPSEGGAWPRDRYGRRVAHVQIDGRDLGDLLVEEGLAVRWNPLSRFDWCRR